MELSANVSPLKDVTSTKNQQPILALDFEAFCYIDQSPHPSKFKEILALLYDVQQYGVKIILFTENIEKAKKCMLDAYGEYAKKRFFRNLVDSQLNRKRTILQYLTPYRASQLATARAVSNTADQHLEYVLFYSPLDSEISKFKVKSNCQLIKIDQADDDNHIEVLREVVANFKEIKDVNERIKEQQLINEKNELLNSQSYAEATHKYYYTKAEAQVIGDITEFLKDIRVNLLVEQNFNQAITSFDKSNTFAIGKLFNTWNIYDCLIQALSILNPKTQYDITYIKAEILGYILNLQQNQNKWFIKNFTKEIYEAFKSFLNLTAKEMEYHISEMGAEGPDKWITWDQINVDTVCFCAVFKIKLHVIHYLYTTRNKIIFSDVKDDDLNIENIEENIVHLLVDEHGVIPVDPEDNRLQDSSIIRLGVYDKTTINRYFKEGEKIPNKTSIKSIKNYTCILQKPLVKPDMIYTGFPSGYNSCIDKIFNQLQQSILKQINNRLTDHHNDLVKNERFARQTADGYEWFFYTAGNNLNEEQSHLRDYLTNAANDCIKEYIVNKVKLYHDPLVFLDVCIYTILPIASALENAWKSYTNELEATSLRAAAISKQIDKCKFRHAFSMTASLSNLNMASPVEIKIPGVHGACMGSLKNFIEELEKEKKRLGGIDINRYTQQFISINQTKQLTQEQLTNDIPSYRGEGRNLLQNSVYHGNYEVAQYLLLTEKAKINFKRNDNDLPILFYWVRALNRDSENTNAQLLFQLLIENGAKLNETSTNSQVVPGGTFIHFAASLGNYLTINFILSYLIQTKMGDANNFQLSSESSQTALYSVAIHDDFSVINDEPSDHYLVAEQFFLYGIVFDSNEIELLVKHYHEKNQPLKLEILLKLFNNLIDKYINESEETFSFISSRHHTRLFLNGNIHEIEAKEYVDIELAKNTVNSWLEQLKLQTLSPTQERKNSASFFDRVASSLKKPFSKPHLTETRPKSGSFSAESLIKTSSHPRLNQTMENKILRPGSVELFPDSNNFLRPRSVTHREMSNPIPPLLGSGGIDRVIMVEILTNLDESGFAAIHYAAMTGCLPLFNYLMDHSKDIAERKKFLSICCHADLTGQKKLKQNYTPIYFAVMFRQVAFVKELINMLARLMPEKINDCCRTPLHAAIEDNDIPIKESERIELVKILLDYALKFNFNSCIYSKDFAGHTPCMKALLTGNKAVLKLFLERKIWIPATDIIDALTKIKDTDHRNKIINLIKEVLTEHSAKLRIYNTFSPRKA